MQVLPGVVEVTIWVAPGIYRDSKLAANINMAAYMRKGFVLAGTESFAGCYDMTSHFSTLQYCAPIDTTSCGWADWSSLQKKTQSNSPFFDHSKWFYYGRVAGRPEYRLEHCGATANCSDP